MTAVHLFALAVLATTPPQEPAAKPADTGCVALLLPSVEGVEDATAVASSIRAIFQSYLTGPSIKSIELEAKLSSQASQEARTKECTKILTVTVLRKSSGGGGSKLGAVAQAAGSTYVPLPSYGAAVAVGAARSGAQAVASAAHSTKAKDEFTMTYRVDNAEGGVILPLKTDKAKAKTDGEDLLTPLIARASNVVATAVEKK